MISPVVIPARFDPHPAKPDDEQYGEVHDELSQRIEDGGELPHPYRRIGMGSGRLAEAGLFFSCAGKGADDPHPRQIFPQDPCQRVQASLHFLMERHGFAHDENDDQHEQGDRQDDDQCQLEVDDHGHDNAADT